jgi:hypothetical protein
MRTREERKALHMHKPNTKPVSGNRTKMNSETVKMEDGLAYQEINVEGQTYYAKLEPDKKKITDPITTLDVYTHDTIYEED